MRRSGKPRERFTRLARTALAVILATGASPVGLLSPSQAQPVAAAGACPPATSQPVPAALATEIQRRNADLSASWLSGDVERRMTHYAADGVSNPDYQPRLHGARAIARYYQVLTSRQRVSAYARQTAEILPLGDDNALERGTFEITYTPVAGGAARSRQGRYSSLWRRQPDGALKLKAEVWGYMSRTDDPALYSLGEPEAPGQAAAPGDPAIAAELTRLNALDAESVKTYDTAAKVARYADDAIYMPYADTPKVGIDAIAAHLIPYTQQGRGVTFESVRVWNEGFEALDGYVVEYPKFEVRWRNGADSGVVSGGGLRLWRRQADCSLKMLRQIATHDHRT